MRVNAFVAARNEGPQAGLENLCGVLVHVRPEDAAAVRQALECLPGTEVHVVTEDGRMVVTVEDAAGQYADETISQFNHIQGVLSVALVYHHFDSDLEGETCS